MDPASMAAPTRDGAGAPAAHALGGGPMQWLSGQVDRRTVIDQLYEVIDPEIGINIVDLGLLFGLRVTEGQVLIQMTLTTPGCPLGGYIEDSIHRALWGLPGVDHIGVDLVWEPPWGPELMSDEAKRQLGWSV